MFQLLKENKQKTTNSAISPAFPVVADYNNFELLFYALASKVAG